MSKGDQTRQVPVTVVHNGNERTINENIAIEEPLEIRLGFGSLEDRKEFPLAMTMRTPGFDRELAAGLIFSKGLVKHPDEIAWITHCSTAYSPDGSQNVIRVELDEEVELDPDQLQPQFYSSSSCEIFAKASTKALTQASHFELNGSLGLSASALKKLAELLIKHQSFTESTSGMHAAASFDDQGNISRVYEDLSRHHALDKLIGHYALNNQLPITEHGIFISGRANFDLLQKCKMAGCSLLVAIGPPSTLAVNTAKQLNITLVGFLNNNSYNIYHGTSVIIDP